MQGIKQLISGAISKVSSTKEVTLEDQQKALDRIMKDSKTTSEPGIFDNILEESKNPRAHKINKSALLKLWQMYMDKRNKSGVVWHTPPNTNTNSLTTDDYYSNQYFEELKYNPTLNENLRIIATQNKNTNLFNDPMQELKKRIDDHTYTSSKPESSFKPNVSNDYLSQHNQQSVPDIKTTDGLSNHYFTASQETEKQQIEDKQSGTPSIGSSKSIQQIKPTANQTSELNSSSNTKKYTKKVTWGENQIIPEPKKIIEKEKASNPSSNVDIKSMTQPPTQAISAQAKLIESKKKLIEGEAKIVKDIIENLSSSEGISSKLTQRQINAISEVFISLDMITPSSLSFPVMIELFILLRENTASHILPNHDTGLFNLMITLVKKIKAKAQEFNINDPEGYRKFMDSQPEQTWDLLDYPPKYNESLNSNSGLPKHIQQVKSTANQTSNRNPSFSIKSTIQPQIQEIAAQAKLTEPKEIIEGEKYKFETTITEIKNLLQSEGKSKKINIKEKVFSEVFETLEKITSKPLKLHALVDLYIRLTTEMQNSRSFTTMHLINICNKAFKKITDILDKEKSSNSEKNSQLYNEIKAKFEAVKGLNEIIG